MKKLYFLLFTILMSAASFGQLTAGDLAFIAYNGDGLDEFAVVALADIPANTSIWFTDNEWDGDSFNNLGEGEIEWSHNAILPAGSVIIIQGNSGTLVSSVGTVSGSGANLGASNETIFALLSEPLETVMATPGFLAGFANDLTGSGAVLTGTGLTVGTDFIDFANDNDGFKYTGSRTSQGSFADYLPLIMDINNNWQIEASDGTLILPISEVAFTENSMATPTISITAPGDGSVIDSGTMSVDLEWNTFNTTGSEVVSVTVNGNTTTPATSPFPIATMDGQTYNVTVQLLDGGGPLDDDSISFSVAFPCTLTIGNITETCDSVNPGTGDTYTAEIEFDNAGNSDYTIDTGGIGTVDDGMIDTMTSGTITISNIPENTNFTVTFTGDAANSGCDFTRFISSPICDPQLELPFTNNFEYGAVAGDLTTVSAGEWEAHSGSGNGPVQYSENSLVFTDYDARASFGGSVIVNPSSSEDVSLPFAEQTSGTVYMSALVNVSAVNGNNYFMHFLGGGFTARVAAQSDGGTGINFGIGATGSATFGSTSFDLNTVYLVVASYNIDSGLSNLYVLTSPTGSEPSSPEATNTGGSGTSVSAVALRQSGGIPNATIDGIRVAKTWSNLSLSNNDFETREFSIFPNPTNTGEVTISSVNATPIAVTVFDILGKQVKNETISNNRLNVSNLKSGIYLLRLTQDGATSTKKLVIR